MGEKSIELGKYIQQARQAAGLTQQELCHQASLSYSTLAKIERGAIKTPSVFTVYRIADVLGISMDDLLGAAVDTQYRKAVSKKTSKTGVSFVYFDINGCLVRFFHAAFALVSRDTGISSNVVETAFWHFNDAVCRGDMSMDEFNHNLARQIGVKTINWNKYYFEAIEPIQEMRDLVMWAAKHYNIGLLSNIMPGQIEIMIKTGVLPDVEYASTIDSSQVKTIKPEQNIYEIAGKKAGVKPPEILFTDDSRTNLMAAERQGWQVLWFDDFQAQDSADRIRSALQF